MSVLFHQSFRRLLLQTLAISIVLITSAITQAAQVTLAWDPNDPAPDGYQVFQRIEGGSYNYSSPVWPQPGDDAQLTTCTVDNLADNTNYFFVVRAFAGTDQSGDSNEVGFRSDVQDPTTYTLSVTAGPNGSISPGTMTVNAGDSQTFTVIPQTHYHVTDVLVDGSSVGPVTSYTFSNVSAAHTISASFGVNTYAISATAGANGSISPSGTATVAYGASQTYSISANSGYRVTDVLVDGSSVGPVTSYTFSNVTASHTISASFGVNAFTISATAGANGSISPSGSATTAYGTSLNYNVSADSGYRVADILVDGSSMGPLSSYTFTNICADHTIAVLFEEDTVQQVVKIWMEAEEGDIYAPMEIVGDANASAGGYVWIPEGDGNFLSPSPDAGRFEYRFDIPHSGDYVVWGRVIANDLSSDSFFVAVDGLEDIVWHTRNGGQETWAWDVVSIRNADDVRDASNPNVFHLAAGTHTLTIRQREDGTKLDRILITNQLDLTPQDFESSLPVMEFGQAQLNQNWTPINFGQPFSHPVVVAGPIGGNGGAPAVLRIRNVTSSGFEMRIQEWDYLDDRHNLETVSYLVMEQGDYTLPDGSRIEASTLSTDATVSGSFKQIEFQQQFDYVPVVMSSIISFNESDAVTGRMKDITTGGFRYLMQEQEANAQIHAAETIAYIAWEPSSGDFGDVSYLVGISDNPVSHKRSIILFDRPFSLDAAFLADLQSVNGANTANLRYWNRDTTEIDVWVDEERSMDNELKHLAESVGYILIAPANAPQ